MNQKQLAEQDREKNTRNGVDLNPFSTTQARHFWALGYSGQPMPDHINPHSKFAGHYKRGQEAAKLKA